MFWRRVRALLSRPRKCPRCGRHRVDRARKHVLLRLMGLHAYRCHPCQFHWYTWRHSRHED